MVNDPFVIGISGSIGSGKSLICHLLAMRGIMPLDADELTHFLLAKGKAGYQQVVQNFGEPYLDDSGNVDRAQLGKNVFDNPHLLQKLESMLHPLISRTVRAILQQSTSPLITLEAIKLYSSDLSQLCDSRWFVTATQAAQKERLKKTRGMDEKAIAERLHQQQFPKEMPIEHYIENSCRLDDVLKQIEIIWGDMRREADGFEQVIDHLAATASMSVLSIDSLEAMDVEIQSTLAEYLPPYQFVDDVDFAQRVILSRTFLSPLNNSSDMLVWQFDHFNTRVRFLKTEENDENLRNGLEKLEQQTSMWGGNCIMVELDAHSLQFKNELRSMGYHVLSDGDILEHPFLPFSIGNKGKIGNHLVKILPDGVWRLIP